MADSQSLFSILIILFALANAVTAIPLHELESMINALRATGYNLFGNAIITSDINYEILSGNSFTIFAPTDSSLFALDMTASAAEYINALHYHVVPRRFSLSELRMFPAGASLHSLDPTHEIILERRRSLVNEVITIDGVAIVVPDLFYGRDIVVHGLGGIIASRSEIGSGQHSPFNMTSDNTNNATVFPPQVNLHDAPTPPPQVNLQVAPTPPSQVNLHVAPTPPPQVKLQVGPSPPPQVNLHIAPAPQIIVDFGGSQPSSNNVKDYSRIESPTPEPAIADYGFPPVNSPEFVSPGFADSPDFINSASFTSSAYETSSNLPDYPDLVEDTVTLSSSVPYNVRRRHADRTGFSKLIHSDTNFQGTSHLEIPEQGLGGIRGDMQAMVGEEEL